MMEEFDDQKSRQGIDDYWAIVLRRKWWILGPLFFGWLIVFASAWFIPAKYMSESRCWSNLPRFPGNLVAPNVEVDLADRVQSMSTQVLSRTRLLGLIERFHLYPGDANSPDDQVKKMRDDIKMDMIRRLLPTPVSSRNWSRSGFPTRRQRSYDRAESDHRA